MSHYHSLGELIWAKIALTQKSQPTSVNTDRKTFDGFLAAHRVEATHILGAAPDLADEILWLTEKLTWKTYFGILKHFPGVSPRESAVGVYYSLADLLWAKVELESRGNAAELKQNYSVFQMLRQANFATVKKNSSSDRSLSWQLYQSEVDLWAGFGNSGVFPGVEPCQSAHQDEHHTSCDKFTMVGNSLLGVSQLPLSPVTWPQASETGKSNRESSIPTKAISTKPNSPENRNGFQEKSPDIAALPPLAPTQWAPSQRENTKPSPVLTTADNRDKVDQEKTPSQLTTFKQLGITTNGPIPASASGSSSPRPVRFTVSENKAFTPFKLTAKKGNEFVPTNEEIFSADSVTQAHMAKTLGGLGRSKWA
ncbi:hypothetical protein GLAREA_11178 [Glarea lozoyensis ATCC 20868]|uniref:Uncharacterized protein n=1 Tax=Glarea lozoyensis (strain ATCC 20868 / MF5171) TaxID=1116229 RepID=S3DED9_GLAL2|nr:uncharacterized protein GLAREA_11178 [Glarea lozoyensis ATCC 20868]EPE35479.1 hypothetical protein GLAREA_11178 [Glarea lozoyensis ATCC 20868]